MSIRDFDRLIGDLTSELCPMKCLGHPFRCFGTWAGITVVYETLVVLLFGVRADLGIVIGEPRFLFETGLALATGLGAALASAWLCIPDMRGHKWMAAVPLSCAAIFFFWAFLNLVFGHDAVIAPRWSGCMIPALMSFFLPMAVLMFMMRRGSTTSPILSGVMNILAVGCAGYVALRLICAADGIGHDLAYHVFPFMALGGAIGFFARRLYRW